METIYSLLQDNSCSDKFYEKLNEAALEMINYFIEKDKSFIDDFVEYIKEKEQEKLRSFNEYAIEFLMIGVFYIEYYENAKAFKNKLLLPFRYYNYQRKKCIRENMPYKKIDIKRGKLINKYLLNRKAAYLEKYIKNVPEFLKKQCEIQSIKEDSILKRKGIIQYYFNLICAEIMNIEYKDRYDNCNNKFIFLPGCLRKSQENCKAEKTYKGLMCVHCNKECNVNKITKLVSDKK